MAVLMGLCFVETAAEPSIKDIPFHRISQWTRSFFQETSLIKVGLYIHLAHNGTPCPSSTEYTSDLFEWSDTDENIHYDDYPEGASIPLVTNSDHPVITIVDKSALASYPYPDLTLVILVILAFPFALYLSLQQSQYIWPDPFADEAYPCSVPPPD
ncbi:uncharacterized protein EDB93DRAFT_1255695 [Suillus bovinus]|uniref:uncharacterized protein n=1 Tax=Suillus bovinus TaxID=48563 RepID=UPI001B883E8E|nr:uncharacterized protein EDB93DRAFT_1255695 [Suillus bovinus]KAG2130805.1 hypothetical protein EDB93DRAFT_1255695 [Suillus bovinus]